MLAALRNPHRFDPLRALVTHLADGDRELAPHLAFVGKDWPDDPLWLCAVRRRDGRRVVLGRADAPADGLIAAVSASCAVPGYFAPVVVDGTPYIDGGVKSPTNADVLVTSDLDLVVAISPMSTAASLPFWRVDTEIRRRAGRTLRTELARLRARGMRTVTFEPGREVLDHSTLDFMNDAKRQEIVTAAFLETGEQARTGERGEMLAGLASRHVA
jgi:NTE family protein